MHFETEERGKRRVYHLRKDLTTLGRDMACDISMASVSVSRRHVSFTREGATLRFKDLGSRNGLKLNGNPVREGVLADGDRLGIGELVLLFRTGEETAASASPLPEPARAVTGDENAPTPLDLAFSAAPAPPPTAPAGTGSEAEPSSQPSPASPWKNRRVLGVAVATVLLVVGAAVAKVLWPKPPAKAEAYTPKQYEDDALQALDVFRGSEDLRLAGSPHQAKLAEARRLLQETDHRLPQKGWANLADRALAFHERLGKDFRTYPYDDAREAWETLKKQRGLPPEVQLLATQRIQWMESENAALKSLLDAQKLAEGGKPDEAIAAMAKVPAGTLAHPEAQAAAAHLRQTALESCLALSDERFRAKDWDGATAALEKAKAYAKSPEDLDPVQSRLQKIQVERREEQDLAQARKAVDEHRFEEAKELLGRIPQESPRRAQAEDLLLAMAKSENLARLKALFAEGKGAEFLQALAALAPGLVDAEETGRLKDLATRADAETRQLQAFQKDGRMLEARQAAQRLKDLLGAGEHERNPWRLAAESFLETWTPAKIADQRFQKGRELLETGGDEIGARKEFDQALAADPTMTAVGELVKKRIYPLVRQLRTQAYDAERDGKFEAAKALLEHAKEILRPSDAEYWDRAVKDLKDLAEMTKAAPTP